MERRAKAEYSKSKQSRIQAKAGAGLAGDLEPVCNVVGRSGGLEPVCNLAGKSGTSHAISTSVSHEVLCINVEDDDDIRILGKLIRVKVRKTTCPEKVHNFYAFSYIVKNRVFFFSYKYLTFSFYWIIMHFRWCVAAACTYSQELQSQKMTNNKTIVCVHYSTMSKPVLRL